MLRAGTKSALFERCAILPWRMSWNEISLLSSSVLCRIHAFIEMSWNGQLMRVRWEPYAPSSKHKEFFKANSAAQLFLHTAEWNIGKTATWPLVVNWWNLNNSIRAFLSWIWWNIQRLIIVLNRIPFYCSARQFSATRYSHKFNDFPSLNATMSDSSIINANNNLDYFPCLNLLDTLVSHYVVKITYMRHL